LQNSACTEGRPSMSAEHGFLSQQVVMVDTRSGRPPAVQCGPPQSIPSQDPSQKLRSGCSESPVSRLPPSRYGWRTGLRQRPCGQQRTVSRETCICACVSGQKRIRRTQRPPALNSTKVVHRWIEPRRPSNNFSYRSQVLGCFQLIRDHTALSVVPRK